MRTSEVKLRLPTWLRLGVKIQERAFWDTNDKKQSLWAVFCAYDSWENLDKVYLCDEETV